MSKIWNVGVVGLNIGRSHLEEGYANNTDRFRVEAICDLDTARLKAVGDEFGIEKRLTSFDDLLAMPEIDIVDICTPPTLHVPMSIAALKAGKHAICEKPLASSLDEIDRLEAAERETGKRLMPIFQYRYGDGVMKAKRLIEAGIAGKPLIATAETAWKRGADYYAVPWRGNWDTERGGVLITHAIHLHDMLVFLMGPVASVFCRMATRVNPIEVEDCVAASLEMESGALVTLSATLGSQVEISRLRLCFQNLTIESSLGAYRPGDDPWTFTPASPEIGKRIDAALKDWAHVPSRFEGLMRAYAPALDSGAPFPVTLADARRSAELVTALYGSAETGAAVSLPLAADHPRRGDWRPLSVQSAKRKSA